jgi:hypothetical protein
LVTGAYLAAIMRAEAVRIKDGGIDSVTSASTKGSGFAGGADPKGYRLLA